MDRPKDIPLHVAIVMDGNGRWAGARGLPRIAGHRAGVKAAEGILEAASGLGIKILTLYTFSTENWKRPEREVSALFNLLEHYIVREGARLHKNNIRFQVIGRIHELPRSLRVKLEGEVSKTKDNTGLVLNLALNYGGRAEIVDAVRDITADGINGKLAPSDIDEKLFSDYLYTKHVPDPDLLVRTSGEYRISNFLLWQMAYSEICIVDKMWPDFKKEDLKKCIVEYGSRKRRYGG